MEGTLEVGKGTAEGLGKPGGIPWITPYLMVKDPSASLAFYEAAFGFARRNVKLGPDGSIMHAEATWQDGLIMLGPEGVCGGAAMSPATQGIASPVTLYVYCGDVDALFDRAVALGAIGKFPPQDMFWGDRICLIVDLDGHSWNFATNKGEIKYDALPEM
jgi:uncharacterized glyoxalase superfamily protein PhnB